MRRNEEANLGHLPVYFTAAIRRLVRASWPFMTRQQEADAEFDEKQRERAGLGACGRVQAISGDNQRRVPGELVAFDSPGANAARERSGQIASKRSCARPLEMIRWVVRSVLKRRSRVADGRRYGCGIY
jgi:hypothetical protein